MVTLETSANDTGSSEAKVALWASGSWAEGSDLCIPVLTSPLMKTTSGDGCDHGDGGTLQQGQFLEGLTAARYQSA